jgi:transcription factor C subunit 3
VSKGSVEETVELMSLSRLNSTGKPTVFPSGTPNRVNISHLRRENEFFRLLESAGGIMAIHSKEFYEGHMKLLQDLAQAGESVSAPVGTKVDKRTMYSTFANLERKGRIKQLKTSMITPTGARRPASLAFLPDVDEDRLHRFLYDLGRSSQPQLPQLDSFVKINEQVEYGAGPSVPRGIPPLQLLQIEKPADDEKERWSKNLDRAQQLLTYDDATIKDVFLAERTTMVQLYGFILGKALRCRQVHLFVLEALESRAPSSSIVSHEKRIVEISFFTHHIPVDLYCSLVAPANYDEDLLALLADDGNRKTLVCDLPSSLQNVLHVGRSRARHYFLDLLEKLRELKLVTPLQQSQSSTPIITCAPNGQHPTTFDTTILEGWSANTSATTPVYWLFHESAPIYLWVASETDPPLWKNASVLHSQDGMNYWKDLQTACLKLEVAVTVQDTGGPENQSTYIGMAKSFRRAVAWRSEYFLTWYQSQYLEQFTEASGLSPLDIPDAKERDAKLSKICWVTCAPRGAVETFYQSNKEKLAKVLEKLIQKEKRAEEAKVSLAKKSEEARLQRERVWSDLLSRCHPTEVPAPAALRIERIHKQFLQAGSVKDVDRWVKEIQVALRETDLASMKGLKMSSKQSQSLPRPVPSPPTIQPSASQDVLSIEDLIEMQGPPLDHDAQNRKRKRKRDNGMPPNFYEVQEKFTPLVAVEVEDQKKVIRRHRFQWKPEFDELARDASVIIRARCRDLPRPDWAGFQQVFPAVPRNTVRQRLVHIKETPGNEAYLRRLEDVWYELWLKHRGSELLPDENPHSTSNFDLINHIRFLRTHVDKHAL